MINKNIDYKIKDILVDFFDINISYFDKKDCIKNNIFNSFNEFIKFNNSDKGIINIEKVRSQTSIKKDNNSFNFHIKKQMDILSQLAGYKNYIQYCYEITDELAMKSKYDNFKYFVFLKFYMSNDISKNDFMDSCSDLVISMGYRSIDDFKNTKNNELARKAGYGSFDLYFKYIDIKKCS